MKDQDNLVADDLDLGNNHAGAQASSDTHHAEGRDTQGEDRGTDQASPRRPRRSRSQEERENNPVRAEREQDDPFNFDQDVVLPPKPGHRQMYVRMSIDGKVDHDNIRDFLNVGWRPRDRESVPEGYFANFRRLSMEEKDFGNVVCRKDSILMEIPEKLYRERVLEPRSQSGKDFRQVIQRTLKTPGHINEFMDVETIR